MNDEITAARKKKRRRYNARRLLAFLIALAMVFAAVAVATSVSRATFLDVGDFFRMLFKTGGYPAALGDRVPLQIERLSMGYAVVTANELMVVNSGGAKTLSAAHSLLDPCIKAAGNRVALFSPGNRDIQVYNRSGILADFKAEYVIIDADIARNGTLALLTGSERYACQLDIYQNGKYTKIMTWYGSSGFGLSVYLREDGDFAAVCQVREVDGKLCTTVTGLDIIHKSERYVATVDSLVTDLYFEGDSVIAVTDKAAVLLRANGETAKEYALSGLPVLGVEREKGPVAIALGDNRKSVVNTVVVLDRALAEQCVIKHVGAVYSMALSGNRLYVLGERVVTEYSLRGEALRRYEVGHDAVAVLELNGAIVIQPDSARRLTRPIKED